jgi:hypothetical protein
LESFLVNYGPSSAFNPNQIVLSNFQKLFLPTDLTVWQRQAGGGSEAQPGDQGRARAGDAEAGRGLGS